jgi:hypothetical protein
MRPATGRRAVMRGSLPGTRADGNSWEAAGKRPAAYMQAGGCFWLRWQVLDSNQVGEADGFTQRRRSKAAHNQGDW